MGDSRIGAAAWLDIEPLWSNAVKGLTNRQKALQGWGQCEADLAERVGEILAGTPPGERTPPAEAAKGPVEEETKDKSGEKTWTIVFEDTDWRSRIDELNACLRSYDLNAMADAIVRRLPRVLKPKDRDYEKHDRGDLAVYREREADEANAVKWLLDYLQAIQHEQAESAAGILADAPHNKAEAKVSKPPTKRRRGRKKADYKTVQQEARLAAEWVRARESGVYKADFAKEKGMTQKDFDRLLDRISARKRASE